MECVILYFSFTEDPDDLRREGVTKISNTGYKLSRVCSILTSLTEKVRTQNFVFMPPPFLMGGHIVSPLSVCTKNGFQAISLEYIGVLDSYLIHRFIIIKCRSSSIKDKIH